MGITQTSYKNNLLERTTFDEDCRQYEKDNEGFREEYYHHKLANIHLSDFLHLLDNGFFSAATGDLEHLPDFAMSPGDHMTYRCSLGGHQGDVAYPDDARMTQVACIRLFEQKVRESIVGHITSDELVIWFTLLRITDEQFSSNFPLFMSRLMAGQEI